MAETNQDLKIIEESRNIFKKALISSMKLIADRYEKDTSYHWIDTKFSPATGDDFPDNDPFKNKNIIYSWIQGRGLESLSTHADWIRANTKDNDNILLASKLDSIVADVSNSLLEAREKNRGHLFFTLNTEGYAINILNGKNFYKKTMDANDHWNFSDIFASKGFFSASIISGDSKLYRYSLEYIKDIYSGIENNLFTSDQIPLSPNSFSQAVKGGLSHTPWMILIGSMTLLVKHGVDWAFELGLKCINHILNNHVNINNKWQNLKEYDYVEYITSSGELWDVNGAVISDPGHALEFVGLCNQFILAAKDSIFINPGKKIKIDEISSLMFPIFKRNFINGFNYKQGGIVKTIDLKSRTYINDEMPWWSLPETMRTAISCFMNTGNENEQSFCMEVYKSCYNSFFNNYVNHNLPGLFAVQTRDRNGNISESIPAVPDVDPGYHSGLTLIDCLQMFDILHPSQD